MGKKGKETKKQNRSAADAAALGPSTADEHSSSTLPPSHLQWSHGPCQHSSEVNRARAGSFHSILPPLSNGVLKYVEQKNFHTMTPVQEATIPLFLQNKDVAVQAVTGSGKTLAFLIPVVERIRKRRFAKNQIGALVLSPTRELAMQTWRVCTELCDAMGLQQPLLLVGGGNSGNSGASHRPVIEDLKHFQKERSDIIIGTPGRIEDLLSRYNVMDMSELEVLILDEADVLLFGKSVMDPTIAAILSKLPRMRRTGIFSATTTFTTNKNIKSLLQRAGMRNPVLVNVQVAAKKVHDDGSVAGDEDSSSGCPRKASNEYTPTSLTNYYLITPLEEKISRLAAFLKSHQREKIIIFFMTCACVDFYGTTLQAILARYGVQVELLHGKLAQKRREKAMERFRDSLSGSALFCTDVAARGVDVENVDWVVQVDAPQDPSQFVHRVGRSARAGKKGSSLIFLSEKEDAYVDLLSNRQVHLVELPSDETCCRQVTTQEHYNEITGNAGSDNVIPDILPQIRKMAMEDRDILEKGTKAFTSYIRAYKEHTCAFIFRFPALDLGRLATSFCLLRLPKMPELREVKGKLKSFTPAGPDIDIFAIPYLDKARETARQKRLTEENAAGGKNAKQIKAEQRKAEQERRQQARRQQAIDKGRHPVKKRGRHQQIVDEWDDLAKEERLYKKLRRGKINTAQYNYLLRGDSKMSSTFDLDSKHFSSGDESDD